MLSLPVEIQEDIFLRLPVKSILNCRYVCKTWCNLLSSSKFVRHHLQHRHSIQKNNPMFLLKRYENLGFMVPGIYSIDYATISCESVNEAVLMEYPFKDNALRFENLGSCNGLICLGISNSGRSTSQDCSVCLWNPSTGEYNNNIPMSPLFVDDQHCYNVRYGFGYDDNTDDYKIVRLANYGNFGRFGAHVYGLRSDSWKPVQTIPYSFLLANRFPGLPFYGTLHWLVITATNSEVILCFDLSNERILDMPFPEDLSSSYPQEAEDSSSFKLLGVIDERLSLVLLVPSVSLDIWVMQKYGDKDSWTRRISTTQEAMIGFGLPKPVRSLENGEILFNKNLKLVLFDTKNDTSRDLKMDDSDFVWRVEDSYLESLVSVYSGAYVGKQKWTINKDTTEKSKPPKMTWGLLFSVLTGLVSYFLT